MSTTYYDVGDVAVLTSTWRVSGVLTTPSTRVLTVVAPDGTETTPSITVASTGVLTAEVPITAAGTWRYRWVGTGAAAGAEEGRLFVRQQQVT